MALLEGHIGAERRLEAAAKRYIEARYFEKNICIPLSSSGTILYESRQVCGN